MPELAGPKELSDALQGRYTIERELGRGGMATVYLAQDLKLHRRVALKLLHPDFGAALGPERFLREIDITARLTHPNILPLHDSGEADGRLFYAMPYVEGESLRQRLAREPQLPVAEAVHIAGQVAAALAHAHGQGFVHRDIKPENILLAGDQALVADFGIARALDLAGGEKLTETGLALGTPAYMSPEQGAGAQVDGRSDLYALGCVAYEMLAGAPPFTGSTAQAVLARHAVDPVPPLRTVRSTVPEPVAAAIERALAKVPADRFESAEEFAAALVSTAAPARWRRHAQTSLRARLMAGSACVAAIAALTAGVVRWRRSAGPAVVPSAARIAVLPFLPAEDDTALARLARDLAITVSASLDGVGGVETADRLSVSAATAGRGTLSSAEGAALARRLGARSVLRGTLVGEGPRVRVDLGLHDTETDAPLTQGITITAHRDSLRALTDSVVWALLRQVWRRGDAPTPSLDAVTTHSLPALRAFLEGERAVERNRWEDAVLAFRGAIAADSSFWLAYFRYALAQSWLEQPVEPEVSAAMYRHREVFPERERLLVEAWETADSLPLQLDLYREITRRFPDYWPGWFLMGDRLFHAGILLGHDWRETQSAFSHAVMLNPKLTPAWGHMWRNSIGLDTTEAARVDARLLEQARADPSTDPIRLHNTLVRRVTLATARSNGAITSPVRAILDTMARHNWEWFTAAPEQIEAAGWSPFLNTGFPAQIELNRDMLRHGMDGAPAAAQLRGIAWSWAVRGAWDSALTTMHEALRLVPRMTHDQELTPLDDYGLAVLGVWLGALGSREAVSRRSAAWATIQRLESGERKASSLWMLAWLDGLSAFARGDQAALRRAREDARRSGHPLGWFLDRSLAPYGRAMAGNRPAAGRELAALQWGCQFGDCGPGIPVMPNLATDRLAAATWLLEAGDTAQATRLLVWYESLQRDWDATYNHVVCAFAFLMWARVEEAQGDVPAARTHYEYFLRRFDAPMPGQRHLVEEARTALARLGADR